LIDPTLAEIQFWVMRIKTVAIWRKIKRVVTPQQTLLTLFSSLIPS